MWSHFSILEVSCSVISKEASSIARNAEDGVAVQKKFAYLSSNRHDDHRFETRTVPCSHLYLP
jgi:hypothetical protein